MKEIFEEEGRPEQATTADLFNPEDDVVAQLCLMHRLRVLYRWKRHYAYTINTLSTMSLCGFLKRPNSEPLS